MNTSFTFKKIAPLLIGLLLAAAGCKPEIKGELGEPSDKVRGLNGTWELEQFIQQDPNNPILEERDLSEFYVQEGIVPLRITLNVSDRSYAVVSTLGRNVFGNTGTWSLDDPYAPSYLTLFGDTDTLRADLGAMVLPTSQQMRLQYERKCSDGFRNVIYKFNFKRIG